MEDAYLNLGTRLGSTRQHQDQVAACGHRECVFLIHTYRESLHRWLCHIVLDSVFVFQTMMRSTSEVRAAETDDRPAAVLAIVSDRTRKKNDSSRDVHYIM
ncbi:unnamed protein product [Albugo candida]|uniref:Uncharacterized protein n=1 Tax=Albugo candida TaxID=65357 RepID=A0A024FTG4_9STRA|nr:unnamed protein product [Albugo candida]|eukprot:CCI10207.1 unnamed protein product [Albugo candida]